MSDEIKVDGGGERKNEGKLPMHLIPTSTYIAMAEVLQIGAMKYSERNWERSMRWSICYSSCLRHLFKWWKGEDLDTETQLNHLKHALCNIAFLIEYLETAPNQDDRPIKRG